MINSNVQTTETNPPKRLKRKWKPKRYKVKYNDFETSNIQRDILEKQDCYSYVDQYFASKLDKSKTVNKLSNKALDSFSASSNCFKFNKTNMTCSTDIEIDKVNVFKSFHDMIDGLKTEQDCRDYLERIRWKGEPICCHCGCQNPNHYRIKTRGEFRGRYKCKDCRKVFSVTIGTIFENSSISLKKWLTAIFLFSADKTGISSYHLHRLMGITQKSAWFMLCRIRLAFKGDENFEFDGSTQVDETLVGGKNKNRNKDKKIPNTQGRSTKVKKIVFGMINNGLVYVQVVPDGKGTTLKPIIRSKVKAGSIVVSDGWRAYNGLWWDYKHVSIAHNKGQYKKGEYHTNGIENFWSLLKLGIVCTYRRLSHKHLHRYCSEFAYRYNTRKVKDGERFILSLIKTEVRLDYKTLTRKVA